MISVLKIDDLNLIEKGSWESRDYGPVELPTVEVYRDSFWTDGKKYLEITLRTFYIGRGYCCYEQFSCEREELAEFCLGEYVKDRLLEKLLSLMNLSLN